MPKGQCHKYTDEQLLFVESNKTLERNQLALLFNEKFGTNQSKEAINALCKRKGWLTGRTGYFSQGQESWNAGTKGATTRNKTSFSKGNVPANVKPLGHERICPKDGFILVKVAEPNPYTKAKTRYRFKHHVVWEGEHGPIPKGMVVRFLDGNKLNCAIENLEMVSKAVHLRLNKMNYSALPADVKPTAKACAELEVKTFEIINQKSR